jgi:hypothetical protein
VAKSCVSSWHAFVLIESALLQPALLGQPKKETCEKAANPSPGTESTAAQETPAERKDWEEEISIPGTPAPQPLCKNPKKM